MKTIGIIGGMSWESTSKYYTLINQYVKKALGGLHSAKIIISSVDFAEIVQHQSSRDTNALIKLLNTHAKKLESAKVDYIAIATNTMHMHADEVMKDVAIPLLHITDATANKIINKGYKTVGLLGTILTMNETFYKDKLLDEYSIHTITPDENDKEIISSIIYNELCLGIIKQDSRENYLSIINKLHQQGAEAIILGCTEIGLLINHNDTHIPVLDTADIHASYIANTCLEL